MPNIYLFLSSNNMNVAHLYTFIESNVLLVLDVPLGQGSQNPCLNNKYLDTIVESNDLLVFDVPHGQGSQNPCLNNKYLDTIVEQ
jgi:hypothetical protein